MLDKKTRARTRKGSHAEGQSRGRAVTRKGSHAEGQSRGRAVTRKGSHAEGQSRGRAVTRGDLRKQEHINTLSDRSERSVCIISMVYHKDSCKSIIKH